MNFQKILKFKIDLKIILIRKKISKKSLMRESLNFRFNIKELNIMI